MPYYAPGSGVGSTVEISEIETLSDGNIIIGDGSGAPTTLAAFSSSTGTLKVANGGTGAASLTGVLKGNGTSAFTAASAGTDYIAPGTANADGSITREAGIQVLDGATVLTTGDGKAYFRIPTRLNGRNLVACAASVLTTSSSGTPTIQIARGRQANASSAFTFADMLSTRITIDQGEYDSKDAATAAVIDTANDDVATGDLIRIDIDTAGTNTAGLFVTLSFQ